MRVAARTRPRRPERIALAFYDSRTNEHNNGDDEPLGEIHRLARERRPGVRDATITWGVPERLYDEILDCYQEGVEN